MSYVKRLYNDQPEDLNYQPPNVSENDFQLTAIELDEMWSFVSEKSNKQGIWVAQCRKTRQVITFHIGKRGKKDAKILWDKLPEKIQENGFFYSDDWDAYKHAIPKNQHSYSKEKKETKPLERLNNTIRQRVSRLVRKSLSFSKKLENHIGALKYFFCQYNLEKQKERFGCGANL